jgi:hypothetical protein
MAVLVAKVQCKLITKAVSSWAGVVHWMLSWHSVAAWVAVLSQGSLASKKGLTAVN